MSTIPLLKVCNKCGHELPNTSEFWHSRKASSDGLSYTCKDCAKTRAKKWQNDNSEYANRKARQYYEGNKAERQAYNKAHVDHIRELKRSPAYKAKNAEYRKRTNDERLAYNRQYKAEHPGHYTKLAREWRKANPEKAKAIMHKRIAAKHQADGEYDADDVKRMYIEQDGRCAYCGIPIYFDLPRDVHVDHVLPLVRFRDNNPENLLLSCSSCNQSKGAKTIPEWVAMRGW